MCRKFNAYRVLTFWTASILCGWTQKRQKYKAKIQDLTQKGEALTMDAETMKTIRQLEDLRRKKPEVFQLLQDAAALPEDKFEVFMQQAMPILKKYMN